MRGSEIAAQHGLILVDTKYEFGKKDGKIMLIDEINTPDSSRYFYADEYQERFEKGFLRSSYQKNLSGNGLWKMDFRGSTGQKVPEMTDDFVNQVSERYIELYEKITGEKFERADISDVRKQN